MRRILNNTGFYTKQIHKKGLGRQIIIANNFSTFPPNIAIHKSVEFQFKFRSLVKLEDLLEYVNLNKQDIQKYGKTLILQFLNEYPMQSFRRSRDQPDLQKKRQKLDIRYEIYNFMNDLSDLNTYEQNLKHAIYRKFLYYMGPEPTVQKLCEQSQNKINQKFKNQQVHLIDALNWLYMLHIDYKQSASAQSFQVIDRQLSKPQIRQYLQNQRGIPMIIKRVHQKDWISMRKYSNIIKFLTHNATFKQRQNMEELIVALERLVNLKLHMVGEKVIPKIIDDAMGKFERDFDYLTKNKNLIMKLFSIFKYLPLNYNIPFFNKIHGFLKGTKELSSHLLLYLPYNKLSQYDVSFLQTKMFTAGREDISLKLIYTIYEPEYKFILTPFMIKESFTNLMQIWKRQTKVQEFNYQIYIALIFRFMKIDSPIIDQKKLKNIFFKLTQNVQGGEYSFLRILSPTGMLTLFQLVYYYDYPIKESLISSKIQTILYNRRQKNTSEIWNNTLIKSIKVHINAFSSKARYFLSNFILQIANNPQTKTAHKLDLLFTIQKSLKPDPKWIKVSNKLSDQLTEDINGFIEEYLKFDHKTLKLTDFIFRKVIEKNVQFSSVIELLSSLHLKIITSLKGKLISPLRKYITSLNLQTFDISKCSMNSLVQAYRLLFNFKKQIPEFMEYFSIKIIEFAKQKCINNQYLNGKQLCSLSNYIMEVVSHTEIQQKTQIIESIIFILKSLRKKQYEGIYVKVYELDFVCANQKYITINEEKILLQADEVIQTMKKKQRTEDFKDLYFIMIKLHCRDFIQLKTFDLRYFIDITTELIDKSMLSLTQIKDILSYDILNQQDPVLIQKLKLFISDMVKLAFRKNKRKHNYFVYKYLLNFFGKLGQKQMIVQIFQLLLQQKLYPLEIRDIIPTISLNEIKNERFAKRILQIIALSDNYITLERMQASSWVQKIYYEYPPNDLNYLTMKYKINLFIETTTLQIKEQMKKTLQDQDRSKEDGFEVDDVEFDKHYKVFIQFAWYCLKYKIVQTSQFKFICRYLFFALEKIKAKIENPEQRKQISKIKLYHVLKYLKEAGFFQADKKQVLQNFRDRKTSIQRVRKVKILNNLQKQLNVMKIQSCEKLENKLSEFSQNLEWKFKQNFSKDNLSNSVTIEYVIRQKSTDKKVKGSFLKTYVIHTVKPYHRTLQSQSVDSNKKFGQKISMKQRKNTQFSQSSIVSQNQDVIAFKEDEDNLLEAQRIQQTDTTKVPSEKQIPKQYFQLVQSQLSLDFKADRVQSQQLQKEKRNQRMQARKPLFGSKQKLKSQVAALQVMPEQKVFTKQFNCILPLQKSQQAYRDYNGYLKVQKSLIELSTGLKCILYDAQKQIFLL